MIFKKLQPFIIIAIIPFLFSCGKAKSDDYTQRYINLSYNLYENGRVYSSADNSSGAIFIDFDTLESVPFCAKPNCNHNNSECISKIIGTNPVIYNNYIYYLTSSQGVNELGNGSREFYIESKMNCVSMETSEIKTISEFSDCVPDTQGGYYLDGNELYFTGTDMGAHEDEYGNIITSNVGGKQFLCSINLETGKYKNYGSIYNDDEQYENASNSRYATIKGEYNGKIYILYSFLKETIPDDLVTFKNDGFVWLAIEFDLAAKTFAESKLPAPLYTNNNVYVGYDKTEAKLLAINGDKQYEFDCNAKIYSASIINNKLFVLNEKKWYDLSDQSEHSMGKYGDYNVISFYNDYYILVNGAKTVKLDEDELKAL